MPSASVAWFRNMNDKLRKIDFERAILAKMGAAEIRAQLFAAGLRTEGDGDMVAVACLKAADPDREITIVGRAGWHEIAGCPDPMFVTPGGEVIGAPAGLDVELSAAARMAPEVAQAGTLDGWRTATSAALLQTGCEHWALGTLSPFAGPIIGLTGLETCGINCSGLTTSGKTTSQRLAVSAWSTPDIRRPGLFESVRATDNAIEALAQRSTGAVLALDELAHVNSKIVGKIIYMITGGTGKRRMTAEATLRNSYVWATFAILSGETSLEQKVRGDGGDWLPGMAVRIIDIDVTGVNRTVDVERLHLINGIEQHYGHAGPAFVRALVEAGLHCQPAALRERVLKAATAIAGGSTTDSAMIRAATPLAILLIAGELAKTFGLIPLEADIRGAVQWAWRRFSGSPDAAALDPEAQVIDSIRGWIVKRWGVTVKSIDADTGVNNRETLAWYDDKVIYIPKARIREAAGNTLKESEIGAILARRELLAARPESDRYTVRWVPKVGKIPAYALSRSEFGRSDHKADPAALTLHQGGRNV
jgi:putative DNA primase/helicase